MRSDPPRLIARLIGLDRVRGILRAAGWLTGPAEDPQVTARMVEDSGPPSQGAISRQPRTDRILWSIEHPVPSGHTLKSRATITLEAGGSPADAIAFELALAQDITDPMLFLSRVVADPAADRVTLNGWAYDTRGRLSVEATVDGVWAGAAPVAGDRPDVRASRPLIATAKTGWRLDLEMPHLAERLSRTPAPQIEVRLYGGRNAAASRRAEIAYEGDLDAAIRKRDLLRRMRRWASEAPTRILDGLVASRAFARRWAADADGEAFEARRIVVHELVRRDAVSGERIICLSNGDRVYADPGCDRVIARSFLLKGAYERGFLEWVESVVKPGDTAIDVGVAYGVVSLALARRRARVVSVEANPRMAEIARRNCRLNGRTGIEIVSMAASDRPGRLTFASVGAHNVGASKVILDASDAARRRFIDEVNALSIIPLEKPDVTEGPLAMADVVAETIEATTLDEVCAARGLRDVALVKIDIEGGELVALRGALGLIGGAFGRPPIVALEFSRIVPVIGGSPEDIFALFADRGWTIHVLQGGKNNGGPLRRIQSAAAAPVHDNIICLPPGWEA